MYKFLGYIVQNTPNWFPDRAKATQFCQQNGVPLDNIVQAYYHAKQEYTAPAETADYIEP